MYPVLIQLGSFQLRTYGLIVALSFLLALWLSLVEAKRKGLDATLVQDFAFYAFLGGIVGARLYYVFISQPEYFVRKPWEILAISHGGLGILGALAGGFLTAVWYCRKHKLSLRQLADVLAPGIIAGQTLGVLGCLATGDSHGKPTGLAWAITYTDPRAMAPLGVPLHPVELYEMAAYLLVFLVVWSTRVRNRIPGLTFLTYLAGYGAARFLVEFFRGHPATFGPGLPAAQVFGLALAGVAIAAALFILRSTPEQRRI